MGQNCSSFDPLILKPVQDCFADIRRQGFKAVLKWYEFISFLSLEKKMEDLLSTVLMAIS